MIVATEAASAIYCQRRHHSLPIDQAPSSTEWPEAHNYCRSVHPGFQSRLGVVDHAAVADWVAASVGSDAWIALKVMRE